MCLWLRAESPKNSLQCCLVLDSLFRLNKTGPNLPALTQNIPKVPTKPWKKKGSEVCGTPAMGFKGVFLHKKRECFQICKLIEPGHFQLFVMFPIERPNHRNNKIRGWGYTFSWTRMNLSCVAFFCSLQNWWGRGIPNSENLFSIRLNFCLRNSEQLEDFVSVINLCPFVGVSKLLKSGNCQVAGRRTGDLSCTQILGPMYGLR